MSMGWVISHRLTGEKGLLSKGVEIIRHRGAELLRFCLTSIVDIRSNYIDYVAVIFGLRRKHKKLLYWPS